MNGNGITPTVELATNNGNGFYPYPVYPMGGGFGGNGGYGFGGDWIWVILLLALFGWGNNGNGNGFFGGNSFDDGYAWLSNGQKEIMQNTNNGFDTLDSHLYEATGIITTNSKANKFTCIGLWWNTTSDVLKV